MIESEFISIVIPGYNEEKRVLRSLKSLSAFCEKHFGRYEIVFVDDGSKDRTREMVHRLRHPQVRLIAYHENHGKGFAVRQGMLAAQGHYRFFTDADLPYDPGAFLTAMDIFHSRPCDAVVGARDHPDSDNRSGWALSRKLASRCFSALVTALLDTPIKDTQCGFKGFAAGAAEKVFSMSTVNGYAFDVELLVLARTMGLRVCKVPVTLVERCHSKVRMGRDAPRMLRDVVKMYRRDTAHGARRTANSERRTGHGERDTAHGARRTEKSLP
jgi:dolichyl-phosphate beta-glucosyltransferase